jgi:signal transduction histidine kinase
MERPFNTALGWRVPGWLLDWGPLAFVGFVGLALTIRRPAESGWRTALLALMLALIALSVRRRWPLWALAVVLAVAAAFNSKAVVVLPVLLAVFTVVEYSERTRIAAAVVASALVVLGTPLIHGLALGFPGVLSRLVAIGLAVSAALYLRTRADYIIGLRERAERVEREQELLSDQALTEERVRIARELHDVVAHNVSLMVVQAQALAATGDGDAGQTEALGRVADLGREAMSEMHRMLGVLRVQEGGAARSPQPGVRDLERLVARTQETGLATTLRVWGVPRELPAGVELSIYRIAQEALTNVIRHAGADSATVTLAYLPHAVDVTVVDDGRGTGPVNGDGHGLMGMRERVTLFGGTLETGVLPDDGGFRVHAVLPLER